MDKVHFASLPSLAKFGIGAGLFFVWTLIETQIIEPFGVYQYMPFYRVDGVCAWDILAITAIYGWLLYLSRTQVGEHE